MHLQVRSVPATSPANLEAFLKVLKQAGLNIEAAGGGDIENGGEFAFAVGEDRVDEAKAALEAEGYHPRIVEVDFRWLSNAPGQLHAFVSQVAATNATRGQVIKDLTIGGPNAQRQILVQIYSVAI